MGFSVLCFSMGLLILASWWRWEAAAIRPVHADEAENAYILAHAMSTGGYRFNPLHHHGPTLNHVLEGVAGLNGWLAFREFEMMPMRMALAFIGVLGLLSFGLFSSVMRREAMLAALGLAALSPLLITYQSTVIHETILGTLGIGFLALALRLAQRPNWATACAAGIAAGLMLSTKITALVPLGSWVLAGACVLFPLRRSMDSPDWFRYGRALALLAAGTLLTAAAVYSSMGRHPAGIWDAIQSVFVYEVDPGHHKPWHYFLGTFLFGQGPLPVWHHETLLIVAALAGALFPWDQPPAQRRWTRFLALSTLIQLGVYSFIAYKTPWLLLISWLQLTLLAGIGIAELFRHRNRFMRIACVCGVCWGGWSLWQSSDWLIHRFHSDPRNPLAYASTSSNIENLPRFLEAHWQETPVDLLGSGLWPLPWYLRTHPDWRLILESRDATYGDEKRLLILSDESFSDLPGALRDHYQALPYTLRPGFPVYLMVPRTLWQQQMLQPGTSDQG
jgi:uncharacterized protein (TIGR03663 family)